MDCYLVISSDGHAGLPPERYRDDLDPQYREAFDVQHAARMAMLEQAGERLEMAQESAKWAERIGPERSLFRAEAQAG